MGLFDKLFSSSSEPKEGKSLPWIALTDISQLEEIAQKSKSKTQVIFKHSTTCGISKMAMRQFEQSYDVTADLDLYYLDLLRFREVSSEAGFKFQVLHQSPQLLVIKNGSAVAHGSHGDVNSIDLDKFI